MHPCHLFPFGCTCVGRSKNTDYHFQLLMLSFMILVNVFLHPFKICIALIEKCYMISFFIPIVNCTSTKDITNVQWDLLRCITCYEYVGIALL